MPLRKSDLYSSIWSAADVLRGGMDASQYKDYVLTLLFMKYVTDRAKSSDALIELPPQQPPEDQTSATLGYGGSFDDMVYWKNKPGIGTHLNQIVERFATHNGLSGSITTANFNDPEKLGSGKEMVDRLSKLIGIFQDERLNFGGNRAGGDDLLGDAYEYLMRNFATQSGKSKGQFYTPAEVSRIMAAVLGVARADRPSYTVYDPTCGSGSLLLKVADAAPHGLTIYGQERDISTRGLAVMNMWLHGHPEAVLKPGNTLSDPKFVEYRGAAKKGLSFGEDLPDTRKAGGRIPHPLRFRSRQSPPSAIRPGATASRRRTTPTDASITSASPPPATATTPSCSTS